MPLNKETKPNLIIIFTPGEVAFHWTLSDNKSLQVSRILFSIPDDFNFAVVRIISIFPLISSPTNCFFKPLGTFSRAPTNISITVTILAQSARAVEYTDCTSAEG